MTVHNPSPDLIFEVTGMMCQKNCGSTVENAIRGVDGVEKVVVVFATNEARVWGKQVNMNNVIDTVELVGFDCTIKSSDSATFESGPDFVISVEGMMCQKNCGSTVEKAIAGVWGVERVVVTFAEKKAEIWGKTASADDLIDSVECVGFDASLAVGLGMNTNNGHLRYEEQEQSKDDGDGDVTLTVEGLRGSKSSADRIVNALLEVDGVFSTDVDINKGTVRISGFAEIEKLQSTLSSAGYKTYQGVVDLKSISSEIDNRGPPSISRTNNSGSAAGSRGKGKDVEEAQNTRQEFLFAVTGMTCSNCALKVERTLSKMPGVAEVAANCVTNRARVILKGEADGGVGKATSGPRDLIEAVQEVGYGCELLDEGNGETDARQSPELAEWRRLLIIALIFGVPTVIVHFGKTFVPYLHMLSMGPGMCNGAVSLGQLLMLILNTPLLVLVGSKFYKAAYIGARHGSYGMDFLVTTGTTISFLYSAVQVVIECKDEESTDHVFFEASGMLLLFVTIGKFIEVYAKGASAGAVSNLLKLQPREATLVIKEGKSTYNNKITTRDSNRGSNRDSNNNANNINSNSRISSYSTVDFIEEEIKVVPLHLVQRGDLLKVLPGERLPTDGYIHAGTSYVDESMITGESVPTTKTTGDTVFGSTVNQNGCLYVRVTAVGSDSALAQIVRLVQNAQMNKAPIQALADRMAGVFTPCVIVLAILTFTTWISLASLGFVPRSYYDEEFGDPFLFAMLFAVSVVVVSCPCALGLATPMAIMVGTAVAASNGILVKGGSHFEMAAKISSVVFDKTGTLTEGRPSVTDTIALEVGHDLIFDENVENGEVEVAKDNVLSLAAMAEQQSEHPLAQAILKCARERGIKIPSVAENAIESITGSGVVCNIDGIDSNRLLVGNRSLLEEFKIPVSPLVDAAMWDLEIQGKTAVLVTKGETVVGILGIGDVLKADAVSTVQALRSQNIDVWMLTGDNRTTAEAVADQLDISKDRVVAGVKPHEKVAKVTDLQTQGFHVAMVGDGINDSPALAQANLGIAIGAGTQVAIEAADMVLVASNLHDLVVALHLSRVVFERIRMNFLWAVVYNLVALPYAAGVFYPITRVALPPQYAGLAMASSSVTVVLSSMALYLYIPPSKGEHMGSHEGNKSRSCCDRLMFWRKRGSVAQSYEQLSTDEEEVGLELGFRPT